MNYTDVEKYEFNFLRGDVSIGSKTFQLAKETLYLSEGRKIDSMDLNELDVLSFYGMTIRCLRSGWKRGTVICGLPMMKTLWEAGLK